MTLETLQPVEKDSYVHEMDWGALDLRNYRTYQYHQISDYIGRNILEVGSGDRNFTREMITGKNAAIERLVSIEPSKTLYAQYQHRSQFPPSVSFHCLDLFDPAIKAFGAFDTVVMIHVLEHIEKDRKAVESLSHCLTPGGHLLIEVPAIPWLYSDHDRSLGHYRRYSKKMLADVFKNTGFVLEKLSWHDPVGVLGSIYFFKLRNLRLKSKEGEQLIGKQGAFYDKVLIPLQSQIERFVRFPFGLSLTAVARKQS